MTYSNIIVKDLREHIERLNGPERWNGSIGEAQAVIGNLEAKLATARAELEARIGARDGLVRLLAYAEQVNDGQQLAVALDTALAALSTARDTTEAPTEVTR